MFWKKKKNPLLNLRAQLLMGDIDLSIFKGKNEIAAIVTDFGTASGGASVVYIADGTCSLYFEKAGGIIGAGGHKNIQIASEIYFNYIDSAEYELVENYDLKFPKTNGFSVKIITKKSRYLIEQQEIDNNPILTSTFFFANSLLSQFRLINENKNEPLTNDQILFSFIKEPNNIGTKATLDEFHNANAVDDGKSALMISTYIKNRKLIETLIHYGADITFHDETGMNSLMVACYLGHSELLDMLCNNETVESKDQNGYTPLMFASNGGHLECVEKMISLHAEINAVDNDNSTPIMFAAQHGYNDIVQLFIDKGADLSVTGKHGYTALSIAEANNNTNTIEIIKKATNNCI